MTGVTARPAATVLVLREGAQGFEVLMLHRVARGFFGGLWVFPGGKVEEIDHSDLAREAVAVPEDADDLPWRSAALRETIEEVGVAITDPPLAEPLRAEGAAVFEQVLAHEAVLDGRRLRLLSQWVTPRSAPVRFDTRFYLARVDDACVAQVDGTEATRHLWMTAEGFLAGADAGQHRVIFPTRRNLERLAAHGRFDAVVAHARTFEVRTISPWIQEIDGREWLCIPEDAGYPVTREPLDRALRG